MMRTNLPLIVSGNTIWPDFLLHSLLEKKGGRPWVRIWLVFDFSKYDLPFSFQNRYQSALVAVTLFRMQGLAVCVLRCVFCGLAYSIRVLAWAYVYNKHDTWEQFYVYRICPPLGSQMLYLIKKNSSANVMNLMTRSSGDALRGSVFGVVRLLDMDVTSRSGGTVYGRDAISKQNV